MGRKEKTNEMANGVMCKLCNIMSGRKESVEIDKHLEKDVSNISLETSEKANSDEFVEKANEPHTDIATIADPKLVSISQHANQNQLDENFVGDVNLNIHKDADEYSGSRNDGKNCLTRFVANNAALVFWANCFLTTLNTALVMICYCGTSTLSIRSICQIAPFNIFCNIISCMINCSKIEC